MSRKKKPITRYYCESCKKEICLADVIIRRKKYGSALCSSCLVRNQKCYKCGKPMIPKIAFEKKYWYCPVCVIGFPISVEEGDKL